jgi:hypothetical protein
MIRFAFIAPFCAALALQAAPLDYSVSWLGNSFSGASNRWVQNFLIHMRVQPDGTVNTWSHWDEGGKKFGVYKDGDVVGNTNVDPNSLETTDKAGRKWKLQFDYVEPKFHEYDFKPRGIACDSEPVNFPGLFEPMALALAIDGQLMVADSQTGPRQQVLFYDITDPKRPKLTRAFGDYGGIASGKPGEVTPTKFWGIRGIGMDAVGNLYVAMSEMRAEKACGTSAGCSFAKVTSPAIARRSPSNPLRARKRRAWRRLETMPLPAAGRNGVGSGLTD